MAHESFNVTKYYDGVYVRSVEGNRLPPGRISTSPSAFRAPLSIKNALDVVATWLDHPSVMLVHAGPKHFLILSELLIGAGAGGSLTAGAHLAALTIEHRATLCSTDRDFGRFPRLYWLNPLERNRLKQ